MTVLSPSLDAFLITSTAIIAPCCYYTFFLPPKYKFTSSSTTAKLRNPLSLFVLLHTIYILHALTLGYPPNLFKALNVSIATPTETLRTMLLRASSGEPLSDGLESLLTRLGNYEVRAFYIRFGHDAVYSCDYCQSFSDYALFTLPTPFVQYIRTVFVVGLLTIRGSHKERWRHLSVAFLVLAAICEGWWIMSVAVRMPTSEQPGRGPGVVMWQDALYGLRHLLFLGLPPFIHCVLPSQAPPASPTTVLMALSPALERTLAKMHLLKYVRGAVMRDPALRERSAEWWAVERVRGEALREDEDVRDAAKRTGWGFDEPEGPLRVNAQTAVRRLLGSFIPGE